MIDFLVILVCIIISPFVLCMGMVTFAICWYLITLVIYCIGVGVCVILDWIDDKF